MSSLSPSRSVDSEVTCFSCIGRPTMLVVADDEESNPSIGMSSDLCEIDLAIDTEAEAEAVQQRVIRHLSISEEELLRGARVPMLLRGFGMILGDVPLTLAEYQLSERVKSIDAFVSHNWNTPRWSQFLALAFHFNLLPAVCISLLVSALAAVLTAYGLLPVVSGSRGGMMEPAFGHCITGVLSQALGMLTFFVVLSFGHDLGRLCGHRGRVAFLDKLCVHQTDEMLKRKGIENLAAIVKRSHTMVVLYSDIYLDKLWTVYELGTFMLVQPEKKLVVRPLFFPLLCLGGIVIRSASCLFFSLWGDEEAPELLNAVWVVVNLVISVLLLRWMHQQVQLKEKLRNFDIRHAKCCSAADRECVEDGIALVARHQGLVPCGASQSEALDAFNAFMREKGPTLFSRSLGRVGIPLEHLLLFWLPEGFRLADECGGAIYSGAFALELLVKIVSNVLFMLGCFPLCIAGVMAAASCAYRILRGRLATFAASFVLVVISSVLLSTCPMVLLMAATLGHAACPITLVFGATMLLASLLVYGVVRLRGRCPPRFAPSLGDQNPAESCAHPA